MKPQSTSLIGGSRSPNGGRFPRGHNESTLGKRLEHPRCVRRLLPNLLGHLRSCQAVRRIVQDIENCLLSASQASPRLRCRAGVDDGGGPEALREQEQCPADILSKTCHGMSLGSHPVFIVHLMMMVFGSAAIATDNSTQLDS